MVHHNEDTEQLTIQILPGSHVQRDWDKDVERVWAREVRNGSFVVLVVSRRICFMLYGDRMAQSAIISQQELDTYAEEIAALATDIRSDKVEVYGARAFVVGPSKENYEKAYKFCDKLACKIKLVKLESKNRAAFMSYDQLGSSNPDNDPEFATIEVYYNSAKRVTPDIYVNNTKVAW